MGNLGSCKIGVFSCKVSHLLAVKTAHLGWVKIWGLGGCDTTKGFVLDVSNTTCAESGVGFRPQGCHEGGIKARASAGKSSKLLGCKTGNCFGWEGIDPIVANFGNNT